MILSNSSYKRIEEEAEKILREFGVTTAPVPIESVAKKRGVNVFSYDLGEEVSGVLVINDDIGTIGYNSSHPKVRQRFTIAHELGHFILHMNKGKDLFIDKDFIVKFRSQKNYSLNELKQEQEANTFAAYLLMPKVFILEEIKQTRYANLTEISVIEELAKVFNVSTQAMTYRIANLNIFSSIY